MQNVDRAKHYGKKALCWALYGAAVGALIGCSRSVPEPEQTSQSSRQDSETVTSIADASLPTVSADHKFVAVWINTDNASLIELQGCLKHLGLYTGEIDGINGPKTSAAFNTWVSYLIDHNGQMNEFDWSACASGIRSASQQHTLYILSRPTSDNENYVTYVPFPSPPLTSDLSYHGPVHVHSYDRRDGTHVRSHTRSR